MKPCRQSRLGLHAIVSPLVLVLALAAGCGNYSNEDLEFMNAMPATEELSAEIPARSALTVGNEAELAKQTHNVVKVFNGLMFEMLGLVDLIRSFPPSERGPNMRSWGPVREDKPSQRAWQWRFVVERTAPKTFAYELLLSRIAEPNTEWPLLTGEFTSAEGARRGVGSFTMATDTLRAQGFPFDDGGLKIRSIDVEYATAELPIMVHMELLTYPDPADTSMWVTTMYDYGAQENGQGALRFSISGNLDPATPAIETLTVTSRWLPTGEGRAEARIELGDGIGATETQCWGPDFNPTYTDKPWAPTPDAPDEDDFGDVTACKLSPL